MKATPYFILLAAVLAANIVSIIGASILDRAQYREIEAIMDQRFKERSTQIGAWVMDRECILKHIGFPIEELPSYIWAQKNKQEAEQ
jgi:hypothetical protein